MWLSPTICTKLSLILFGLLVVGRTNSFRHTANTDKKKVEGTQSPGWKPAAGNVSTIIEQTVNKETRIGEKKERRIFKNLSTIHTPDDRRSKQLRKYPGSRTGIQNSIDLNSAKNSHAKASLLTQLFSLSLGDRFRRSIWEYLLPSVRERIESYYRDGPSVQNFENRDSESGEQNATEDGVHQNEWQQLFAEVLKADSFNSELSKLIDDSVDSALHQNSPNRHPNLVLRDTAQHENKSATNMPEVGGSNTEGITAMSPEKPSESEVASEFKISQTASETEISRKNTSKLVMSQKMTVREDGSENDFESNRDRLVRNYSSEETELPDVKGDSRGSPAVLSTGMSNRNSEIMAKSGRTATEASPSSGIGAFAQPLYSAAAKLQEAEIPESKRIEEGIKKSSGSLEKDKFRKLRNGKLRPPTDLSGLIVSKKKQQEVLAKKESQRRKLNTITANKRFIDAIIPGKKQQKPMFEKKSLSRQLNTTITTKHFNDAIRVEKKQQNPLLKKINDKFDFHDVQSGKSETCKKECQKNNLKKEQQKETKNAIDVKKKRQPKPNFKKAAPTVLKSDSSGNSSDIIEASILAYPSAEVIIRAVQSVEEEEEPKIRTDHRKRLKKVYGRRPTLKSADNEASAAAISTTGSADGEKGDDEKKAAASGSRYQPMLIFLALWMKCLLMSSSF